MFKIGRIAHCRSLPHKWQKIKFQSCLDEVAPSGTSGNKTRLQIFHFILEAERLFFFIKVTASNPKSAISTLKRRDSLQPPCGPSQFYSSNYCNVFPGEVINWQPADQILVPGEILTQSCSHILSLLTLKTRRQIIFNDTCKKEAGKVFLLHAHTTT